VLLPTVLLTLAIAAMVLWIGHPSAPDEPWAHRLGCVLPLSAVAGLVLAWAATR
jgi:hypothetical protein